MCDNNEDAFDLFDNAREANNENLVVHDAILGPEALLPFKGKD